jgi:hypothetical protein
MKTACGAVLIASQDVVEVSCLKRLKKERGVFPLRFESMTKDFERACERRRGNVQNLRFTISAMEQLVASLKKD